MAGGQGKSSFEAGTSPVEVVCIQLLAGSAGAHPMELTVPGRKKGQQNWDCGGDNKDGSCVLEPLLNRGKFIPWKVGIVTLKLCALYTGA